jgi:hypothetical protein
MARKRGTLGYHYVHGLRAAIRFNAQAFAFSIVVTSSFGVVAAYEGAPGVGEVYAFMAGAVVGFVAVLAVATRAFTRAEMGAEPTEVLVAAAALSLGSTACGLGAATLVARFLSGIAAWGLAPFVGTAAFLIVLGLEFGLAEELDEE